MYEEDELQVEKTYSMEDLKFATRFFLVYGIGFGLYTGYLIWGI